MIKGTHHSEETKILMSLKQSGDKNHNYVPNVKRFCLVCGGPFEVIPSRTKKYCSKKCAGIARIGKPCPHVGVPRSQATKDKISNTRLARNIKHSPETIAQMRIDRKGKPSPKKGLPGHKHTKEAKDAISIALSGENSYLWKGGISFIPYTPEFNHMLKEDIRELHGRICQVCGCPESECNESLLIHHIDYDKSNNSEVNLIPLCRSCHGKTNTNRIYWEDYFTKLQISKIKIN